jgi:hypothetical protein
VGGKTNTSQQQIQVPADVLSRYGAVNQQAQQTAATPFQQYSTNPDAFVAPLTDTQNAGIANTNAAVGMAQPYFSAAGQDITKAQSNADPLNAQAGAGFSSALAGAQPYNAGATGLALAGAQAVNPSSLDAASIQKYISPYLSTVLGSTAGLLNQNNQQQQAGQLGNAITSGAFGGDRAGIAAANLAQQQNLGNASIYSGILNNAYTNALSTAQQQQGVGLGAAQANRAALSGAASQIQGIGQQGYEQGTGTAAAQAGLGQQVFNQGITASGAQSGLGSAAQTAALQAAQAQLAAGQVQQQTQQAGNTALYNQFLQQQSYPFQVAQFLANIAEGTGSLSGSTTTTTQPGSLFSDKRVKDDIRKVGKTFDGQTIYTFKYKGDDTTHIGLMAQDVEKRHPDAVGLAAGIKTVDYAKATDDAAERGKFKRGGLALIVDHDNYAEGGSPGFDPQLMQQILQNAQGMYGPTMGGLAGASAAGPYGGVGRVPQANVPVGALKTAGELPAQPNGLAQAKQFADLASDAAKGADWFKDKLGSKPANDDMPPFRDGGLARRYASGGMPYSGGLDIPDEEPQYKLQTAPALGKSGSTGDDVKTIADIAKTAAMFMNRGGAIGYASGGSPNFDETGLGFGVSAPDIGSPNFDETGMGLGDVTSKSANYVPTVADMRAFAAKSAAKSSSGQRRGLGAKSPADAWADGPPAGLGQVDVSPEPNALADGPSIAAPNAAPLSLNTNTPEPGNIAPASGSPLANLGDSAGNVVHSIASKVAPQGGYLDRLFHGDEKTLVPFLAGLGAFTAAPTRNFGTALAQGLSAGAQTYPKLQQMELERAKTAAGTGQIQAQTGLADVQAYKALQDSAPPGYQVVPGAAPNGHGIIAIPGKPYHYELKVNLADFGSSAGAAEPHGATLAPQTGIAPSANTDAVMRDQYKVDPSQPGVANRERLFALNPALAPQDEAAAAAAQKRIGSLAEADQNHRQILQLGQAINKLSDGTLTGQGADFERRSQLANVYNTAIGILGLPQDKTVTSDLTQSQIQEKIRTLLGSQLAHSNDEKAASIAHALTSVLPGGEQQKAASNEVLSSMMVANQQARDFPQYYNSYTGKYGVSLNAEPSFQHDMGSTYDREQKALPQFLGSRSFDPAMRALHDPNPEKRARAAAMIDQKYGANFHRYFMGN